MFVPTRSNAVIEYAQIQAFLVPIESSPPAQFSELQDLDVEIFPIRVEM